MVRSTIVRIVDFCAYHRRAVIVVGLLVMLGAACFDVIKFSINADVDSLIAQTLPWHQRQMQWSEAFPQKGISIVVTAPTIENADIASSALAQGLARDPAHFPRVAQPDGGAFFARNGLLFQSTAEVARTAEGLTQVQPLIAGLAFDPSLRGVMKTLSFAADGVGEGKVTLDQLAWPLSLADQTLSDVLAGKSATFSWQALLRGRPLPAAQLRHFIEVQPALDFSALEPGRRATARIRSAAAALDLRGHFGATVALAGQVPMNDDQFSVISQSAWRDTLTALLGVLLILWLALRSWKIIAAVFLSLLVGLAATAALGLAMVGSFNLISIAFFVLFVGLGVDFGIQFSVRYRAERHDHRNLRAALRAAARKVADPLALAAAATAVGFFAFLPTDYRGLSELGLIAGCGMLIAFFCSITLVPAMLALLNPEGEPAAIGFQGLAPLDDFLQRHRIAVIAGTVLVVLAASPLLARLTFDFNPVDLQNPNSASVITYRQLQHDPETSGNDAELLAPSLASADQMAAHLATLPEVSRVLTLTSFVPAEQEQKRAALSGAAQRLSGALRPKGLQPQPSDQDNVTAIKAAAAALSRVAGSATSASAEQARHVADLLGRLAGADAAVRATASAVLVTPLAYDLDRLRTSLTPESVTIKNLPPTLVRDWLLPDGQARVQALPNGDPNNDSTLRSFATAVLRAEPSATGPAISDYQSGITILRSFIEAGLLALAAIAVLLLITLRRWLDLLLTLVPLLLAGAVTLEICALAGLALNFANIIALPLLLGVGVAFKIYYIMAWRAGTTGLLQSTLTRAVVFSAMTNAIAFGSMWASHDPGMSSMGEMMALALLCTMAAAVLFQPVLMGRPRQSETSERPIGKWRDAAE